MVCGFHIDYPFALLIELIQFLKLPTVSTQTCVITHICGWKLCDEIRSNQHFRRWISFCSMNFVLSLQFFYAIRIILRFLKNMLCSTFLTFFLFSLNSSSFNGNFMDSFNVTQSMDCNHIKELIWHQIIWSFFLKNALKFLWI